MMLQKYSMYNTAYLCSLYRLTEGAQKGLLQVIWSNLTSQMGSPREHGSEMCPDGF